MSRDIDFATVFIGVDAATTEVIESATRIWATRIGFSIVGWASVGTSIKVR